MKTLSRLVGCAIVSMAMGQISHAQDSVWTGAVDSNFENPANWTDGAPATSAFLAIIDGGNNLPIVIGADAGTINVGAIQLGPEELGGSLVQNGGTLIIDGDDIGQESAIGIFGSEGSSWVLNGDATVLYDSPLAGGGLDSDGTGKDFDVGKSVPEEAEGVLELHDNAVFRISDDLKVADGDFGNGAVIMDGNSKMTIGSGISASGIARFELSGNALLVTGNSADPGDSQNGATNEGYLTLSTGAEEEATITVRENAQIYARTLQQRNGFSSIDLQDNAQFHVFEVFDNAAPDPGNATVSGPASGPQRTSHLASTGTAEMLITLSGSSQFTVDSDLEDSAWSGLALSGGNNSGGNTEGGITEVEISDQASFVIAQDLHMTLGIGDLAQSTLSIKGPDATVSIGGDLRMALDDLDEENLGTATLEAILTGSSHSTITVGGTAMIANGFLSVGFEDYTPVGGEVYELLTANEISGTFLDTVLPALPDGLSWDLAVGATDIVLSVAGGTVGDFDGNGTLDAADIDLLSAAVAANDMNARFDVNGDSVVDNADRLSWINDVKGTYVGDSNFDGEFNSGDLVTVFTVGEYEDGTAGNSTWADGDWDGNGDFDSSDFVAAFSAGGYEQGPRAAVAAAVPEPASVTLAAFAALATLLTRRRK